MTANLKAAGERTEKCIESYEQKLLKHNLTYSLSDFSFKISNCMSLDKQSNSVIKYLISRGFCDYKQFEWKFFVPYQTTLKTKLKLNTLLLE